MVKCYAYVDGFNLYYGAVKETPFKWLDLDALLRLYVPDNYNLAAIRYYTAMVKGRVTDPGAPGRQRVYLRALKTIPHLKITMGTFMVRPTTLPMRRKFFGWRPRVQVLKIEEKGSDVNLASHLLLDAFEHNFDAALVVSNDSDLAEPVRIVRQEMNLPVGILSPHSDKLSHSLKRQASFVKVIRQGALARSQFPDTLTDGRGEFTKPAAWSLSRSVSESWDGPRAWGRIPHAPFGFAAALFAALALACAPASPPQPPEELVRVPGEGTAVIYVEAPRRLAGPLLKTFEEQTGIDVQPQYRQPIGEGFGDTLRSEAAAGRVDLVWADGPLTACELAEAGLARVFRPLGARPVLPLYRDPEFRWIGFAANPRVIIYNSRQVDRAGAPVSIHDMARGPWAGKGALARPERGGAAYHAAFLFAAWGPERGREFFEAILKNGTRIVEEDAEVRRLVASGEVQWGFVGLDEAICAKREAEPVQIVYPDRISFPGTAIPAQIAILIEGGPHPEQARGLYGWMFEKEAGFVLGTHDCAMVTLLPDMPKHDWVPALSTFNIAPIDSGAVCRAWKEQAPYLRAWGRSAPPAAAPATGATAR